MRRLLALLAVFALLAGNIGAVAAQDATPGAMGPSKLSQLGLPTLQLTASGGALQAPAEVAAGQTLIVLDNQMEFPTGVSIVQLPEGTSMEEAMMVLGPPPAPASPEAGASPAGGEEQGGPPPPLFYDMTWGGGVFAAPGIPGEIVVNLTPGEWYLVGDPESGIAPVSINVTGEAASPAAGAEITADAEVTLDNENGHFYFEMPDNVAAGDQIWKVTNGGDQPHEMFISKTPRRLTLDEVQILINLPEDQLPPEGVPNPAEFEDMGGLAPISHDQTVYFELNLEPGAYVAVCFMPDKEDGAPHALKGMVTVFEIPEEGQTVEPPASPAPMEHDMGTPDY
jgi:hypothetical protein